jgi:hypothetical protein
VKEMVGATGRSARNAFRRTEDLLALVETGQEPREKSGVDVREVVDRVLAESTGAIKTEGPAWS